MKYVNIGNILAINSYWVGLSFMWNSLHVIILPAVLLHLVPGEYKNTYLGLLTLVGLVIAMIVQPISGALSDSWASRVGRRRPLIALGTSFDFVFLVSLAWSGNLFWVAFGYIGLQFSSNIAHGPAQGLLPDMVPEEKLGQASGVKNLMDMSGLVVSSLLVGRLLSEETRHPVGVMLLVAIVLAVFALPTLFGVREVPSTRPENIERKPLNITETMSDVTNILKSSFGWIIFSRLAYLASIYGIQTFAQYYVRDVLAVSNPIKLTGDLLAAITLALIVFSLIGGWIGDRIGHRRLLTLASLIGAAGCFLLLWARTPERLLIFGGVLGVGIGLFLTGNWALANEQAPSDQAGKYMGLTNLATAGAGVIGRIEGPMIDYLNGLNPGAWWGYTTLFLLGVVGMLFSILLLRNVKDNIASVNRSQGG